MESHWVVKRKLRKRYDLSAPVYDLMYSNEQRLKHEAALSMLKFEEGDIILDNGCGSGLLTKRISGKRLYVVAVDLSMGLLRKAKAESSRQTIIDFTCCDVDNLPFSDGVFHKVLAVTVLQNLPCVATSLGEMVRVGRKGCRFIVTFLKKRFTLKASASLLNEAGLIVLGLKETAELKDYIFLCGKAQNPRNPDPTTSFLSHLATIESSWSQVRSL